MAANAAAIASAGIEAYLRAYSERDLLRFLTCGSVDDGKSTLIGRLLHDSQTIYEDQLAAARRDSVRHGTTGEEVDLALLLDGLEAEREQGITIDVAYRYFATPRRKFIIADTPGHEQYTRNMATGASTCNLAVLLIDAGKGALDQTRRHAFIASLLGIRHLVVAVNKMDMVGYSQQRFEAIRDDVSAFAAKLQANDIVFIPISALRGDNVVHRSEAMSWYQGSPLLDHLETVHIAGDRNLIDLRFPVQYVMRSADAHYRLYAGSVASGVIRKGQEVLVLPAAVRTRIRSIEQFGGELDAAFVPMAVGLTLEEQVDVSRGDTIVGVNNVPHLAHEIEAMVVWMNQSAMAPGMQYLLKQTTVHAPATVTDLRYRINVNTLHRESADVLQLNEIGRIRIETPRLLAFDAYTSNRATGAFILIDRLTNETVAGGMILDREAADAIAPRVRRSDARTLVAAWERASRLGHAPLVVTLSGRTREERLSAAYELERRLVDRGMVASVVDPEELGTTLRQTLEVVRLLYRLGTVVVLPTELATEDLEMVRLPMGGLASAGDEGSRLLGLLDEGGLPRQAPGDGIR